MIKFIFELKNHKNQIICKNVIIISKITLYL